jgi:hypothetical protein
MDDVLDPKRSPLDSPDSPMTDVPDTIATPEGDNEAPPDAPLTPIEPPIERPRSSQPIRRA